MKTTKQILHTIILTLFILLSTISLSSCRNNSIEREVNKILKSDLNTSVEIIKLYYNEEKQGCYVEFQTKTYTDKAAIKLNTGEIVYESEYDYWGEKAEYLRKQNPINESLLHEYNQKILDAAWYAGYSFSVAVFENNGRPEDSDWQRLK